METPTERYRSTDLYRTLVSTQQISPTTDHEELRFIPNHAKCGGTWDAKHLDKFIDTKWGSGKNTILTATRPMTQVNSMQKTENLRALTSQGSHFFRNGPRFTPDRDKAYLSNLTKDFTIKEARFDPNILVMRSKQQQEKLMNFCEKELASPDKTFNPEKLQFSEQVSSLVSPKERRLEMLEFKAHQAALAKYKEKKMDLTKKYRIHKRAYRSGILGIDNPINDDTLLYEEEHENRKKKINDIQKIEQRRLKQLDTFTGSNAALEFFNRKHEKTTQLPPAKIVGKNRKGLVFMEHTQTWKDSTYRLFGEPPVHYSVDRALYLKNQETKGKTWDIISSVDTTSMLKSYREKKD